MQTDSLSVLQALRQAAATAAADAEMGAALPGVPCGIRLALQGAAGAPAAIVHDHAGGNWLTLRALAGDWARMQQPQPPVGWHSFTAAQRQGVLQVEGEALQVAQCLHALERLFEILRGQVAAGEPFQPDLSSVAGRYLQVALPEGPCLIHAEAAGDAAAPLLVMLHTAGADGRQFHALLGDAQLQRQWHMVAFDMPGHGRSGLPHDAWQGYRLGRTRYLGVLRSVLESITQGRRAVLLGCSMGAAMALHAARELPALVQGAVALEAPPRSPGRRTAALVHAQVNQAAHNPSYVRGLMGPQSPLADRRRAAWIYSQGGFGIYAGDLWFYSDDFDAARDVAGLDGTHLPVELLTGSFDHSATPADSAQVAALIPGAVFHEMPQLGHFPMTEHPRLFLAHLRPALARVAARLPTSNACKETCS